MKISSYQAEKMKFGGIIMQEKYRCPWCSSDEMVYGAQTDRARIMPNYCSFLCSSVYRFELSKKCRMRQALTIASGIFLSTI